ncbi:hypothetical protein CPS_0249 [Colwellia psychrerythraea 34H]|uniref:Uncharacterized protein n=1 Tax=Colwellia psychrerythraea (strain 34H / ATCC BAA-681) TaxID=167879 RepID=Q48A97_COLP3|nr:hypothetical protein CPS_0249 [Colwellia psychrerythraea 34H]
MSSTRIASANVNIKIKPYKNNLAYEDKLSNMAKKLR